MATTIIGGNETGLLDSTHLLLNRNDQARSSLGEDAQARVVAYIKGQLPALDADVKAGTQIELHGFILLIDGQYENTRVITDQFFRQIGDGIPPGVAFTHIIRAGDTLQGIATAHYGSSAYWYLIAEANGLSGSEELREGTTLTVPNRIANSLNNSDTYRLYNENEIIGNTSPEVFTIKKKKKWYQKLIQIIIVVIIVVAAVVAATIVGPAVFGAVGPAIGGVAGVIAGTVAAAAAGYAIGYATSVVTQGLAILAGLQDKFDWKAARDMAKGFAVSTAAAGLADWATAKISNPLLQGLTKGAIEYGSQHLKDGEITNRSGLLLAMLPGAETLTEQDKWYTTALKFIDKNKSTVGTGLSLLEKSQSGSVNTLDWVGAAAGVLGAQMGEGAAYNKLTSGGIEFNWARIGQEALLAGAGALIVGAKYGSDAGLSFFGNQFGQSVGSAVVERMKLSDDLGFITPAERAQILDNPNLSDAERLQVVSQLAGARREAQVALAARRREEEQERPVPLMLASTSGMTDVGPMWALPSAGPVLDDDSGMTFSAGTDEPAGAAVAMAGSGDASATGAISNDQPTLDELRQKFHSGLRAIFTASQYGLDENLSAAQRDTILELRGHGHEQLTEALAAMQNHPELIQEALSISGAWLAKNGPDQRALRPALEGTVGLALYGDPTDLNQAMALGAGLQAIHKNKAVAYHGTLALMGTLARTGDVDDIVNTIVDSSALSYKGATAWQAINSDAATAVIGLVGAAGAIMSRVLGAAAGRFRALGAEATARGSANPVTRAASIRGSQLHADRPGRLPDQLRQRYPETQFEFTRPGTPGQDVRVVGGRHPSDYPGSSWPVGINHGDFKPNTPGGQATFKRDQKTKWSQPTYMLPYDPKAGTLK